MSCLYCGAEEDRIDGYCSIYCRDIAEAENDYYDLLKRVREAVEEMQNKGRSVHLMTGIGFAMTILRKHLPELEDK